MTATEPVSHHDAAAPGAVTDPVCGMQVDPATARHRAEHAGKQYFFCGPRCLERFTAEPERFVGGGKPAAPVGAGKTQWTCPMHPQIVREGPGSCPICGMALEPMMPTGEDAENPELRDMTRRFWVCLGLSAPLLEIDRKSTRLNSSHSQISYAVFCLKKKIKEYLSNFGLSDIRNPR